MREVCKAFPTPRGPVEILHAADLDIAMGDFVIMTGPSGSGKTTFLNLAGLLDKPSSGSFRFNGQEIAPLTEQALSALRKHKVGMVFQNFNLLTHRTALENVVFRFRYLDLPIDQARGLARDALDRVGLAALADQPARLLSGGEMQRVAIARAVAQRPDLLLADEPTGNLDRQVSGKVMEIFRQLNTEGITIVLVTHNEDLLSSASRHLVCEDGTIREAPL
jgi:putative ABC transport system ATP-binding protein